MSRSRTTYAIVAVGILLVAAACGPRRTSSTGSTVAVGHLGLSPEGVAARRYESYQKQVAAEPGAVRTKSGLVYRDLEAGSGRAPKASDTVTVRYRTVNADGVVIEDSAQHGGAVTVDLAQLQPCMREALQLMRTGGTSRFVCPMPQGRAADSIPPPLAVETTLVAVGEPLPAPGH